MDKRQENEVSRKCSIRSSEINDMAQAKLTMALSRYDRHIPFFDGSVKAEGSEFNNYKSGPAGAAETWPGPPRAHVTKTRVRYLRAFLVLVPDGKKPWDAIYSDPGFPAAAL